MVASAYFARSSVIFALASATVLLISPERKRVSSGAIVALTGSSAAEKTSRHSMSAIIPESAYQFSRK